MKITMRFMRQMSVLVELNGRTEENVLSGKTTPYNSEQFSKDLLEIEKFANAQTGIRLHIWTEVEPHDATD